MRLVDVEMTEGVRPADGIAMGEVFRGDEDGVFVRAGGRSVVRLVEVQAAGRRAMAVEEFVVGRPEFVGSVLGG